MPWDDELNDEQRRRKAPPRGALMAAANPNPRVSPANPSGGRTLGEMFEGLAGPSEAPTDPFSAAKIGPVPEPTEPTPKEKQAADLRARADAALAASRTGEIQHPPARTPAPSTSAPQPKVGSGPPLAGAQGTTPQTEAQEFQSRTIPVDMGGGHVVWTDPESALAYGRAGGKGIERGKAVAESGNREDVASQGHGAQVARGSAGSAYLRPSQKVQLPPPTDRRPYSEKVRSLEATMPKVDLTAPGSNWSFQGGIEGGPGMARTGTRELSGLEQATSRREWLERRADEERAMEVARAEREQAMKQAEVDPLEALRIKAQGQYGGDVAKVALDVNARRAALDAYSQVHSKIEAARDELAKAVVGSPQEARLKEYIDLLEREARDRANIIMGGRLVDPRPDMWSAFSGFASAPGPGAAGTPTTGAR